jgi:hypothetical protein
VDAGTEAADVAGLYLVDDDAQHKHSLGGDGLCPSIIPPGGFLVVASMRSGPRRLDASNTDSALLAGGAPPCSTSAPAPLNSQNPHPLCAGAHLHSAVLDRAEVSLRPRHPKRCEAVL